MLTLKAYQATICTKSVDPRVNNLDLVCGKTYIHADRQTGRETGRIAVHCREHTVAFSCRAKCDKLRKQTMWPSSG